MEQPRPERTYKYDEFGVLRWKHKMRDNDTLHIEGHDPINPLLENEDLSDEVHEAIRNVRDSLKIAQNIAVSIFGADWQSHVFAIYDRYEVERRRLELEDE